MTGRLRFQLEGGPAGEFLTRLRHDLRTPINAILGYSELLLEDAHTANPEAAVLEEGLQGLATAGRELLAQVHHLLESPSVEVVDRQALRADLIFGLRVPAQTLVADCARLLQTAQAAGVALAAFLPDLERIRSAGEALIGIVDEAAAGDLTSPKPDGALGVAAAPPSGVGPARASVQIGSLLVVDDNEINRDLLNRHLLRQGHSVATAENGLQALERLRAGHFDLVLLDVLMPELDGYETLARMKADEALHEIPVIVISALDEIAGVARFIEMGAEDYLPKPFDPALLRARIEACLEKKRLRDQEVEYLKNVSVVTAAAAAVEADRPVPENLQGVAERIDALGQLARVFQRMAREVREREARLKQQVQDLRIEIDEVRKAKQVAEITETEYFQTLQHKARRLRAESEAGRRGRETGKE